MRLDEPGHTITLGVIALVIGAALITAGITSLSIAFPM